MATDINLDFRREKCKYMADRFNLFTELTGIKAFRNFDIIRFKDARGDILNERQIVRCLPNDTRSVKFADKTKTRFSIYEMGTEHNIWMRGPVSRKIKYDAVKGKLTFVAAINKRIGISLEYHFFDNTFSLFCNNGQTLKIDFNGKPGESTGNNNCLSVKVTDSSGESRGFVIGEAAVCFKELGGKVSSKPLSGDLTDEGRKRLAEACLLHPVINGLFWDILSELDTLFPGVLNFLKKRTKIEACFGRTGEQNFTAEELIEQSKIGDFKIKKGYQRVRKGVR